MQKIFKTGRIFWEKAHGVCAVVKTATKKALFYSHTTAEKAMNQSETLLRPSQRTPFVRHDIICQD